MGEDAKPKIPFDEVHQVLESILKDGKYLVLAIEKEDVDKEDGQLYAFTNFKRPQLIKLVGDFRDSVIGNDTIDSHLKKRDLGL